MAQRSSQAVPRGAAQPGVLLPGCGPAAAATHGAGAAARGGAAGALPARPARPLAATTSGAWQGALRHPNIYHLIKRTSTFVSSFEVLRRRPETVQCSCAAGSMRPQHRRAEQCLPVRFCARIQHNAGSAGQQQAGQRRSCGAPASRAGTTRAMQPAGGHDTAPAQRSTPLARKGAMLGEETSKLLRLCIPWTLHNHGPALHAAFRNQSCVAQPTMYCTSMHCAMRAGSPGHLHVQHGMEQ